MNYSTPYQALQDIIHRYNVGTEANKQLPLIPFHGLRHTSATLLIASKQDMKTVSSLLGGAAREVQVCPYVFYEMCINSNGTYSLCRFDWNHAMILDQHVSAPPTPKKIWDSITLWNFQQQFLRKERKLMTVLSCPKCGILKQGVPEDLDEFADEILDEM